MQWFKCKTPDIPNVDRSALKKDILETIFAHNMTPVYEDVCQDLGWDVDSAALERMKTANAEKLQELADKIKDAEENLGEMEVRDALLAKADYFAEIGDKDAAIDAYAATEAKTAGAGPKMDLAFSLLRLHISRGDWTAVKEGIARAQDLFSKGGDWERKNRLKVYEAVFLTATRQFRRAAELFLDSIATFTATELMPFTQCVFYTVSLAVVALDRPTLKEQVIDNPEILSVIDSVPYLRSFSESLYNSRYAEFFTAFAGLTDALRSDRIIHPHFRCYMREARVVAYSQFLESYKSVTMAAMATAFGVNSDFLDGELADFIVAGRLAAKIDRVSGTVETTRPDAKNAAYQSALRQGDQLLNKLQKLSKVVDIE
jgi:26S proteasome regulatory subunit N7